MLVVCYSIYDMILCLLYGGKAKAVFLLFICFGIYQHKRRGKALTNL